MMTSARPMAMSRSRVQMRISLRRLFAEEAVAGAEAAGALAEAGAEQRAGPGFSGEVAVPRCLWSERSILGTWLFIAWASRRAPDAILIPCAEKVRRRKALHPLRFRQTGPRYMLYSSTLWLNGLGRDGSVGDIRRVGGKRVIEGSERGNDRRLCAKNQLPKRGFVETTLPGTLELTIRPTALRADGQAYRCRILPFEDAPKGRRLETFGENNLQAFAMRREGCLRFRNRAQRGRAQAAGLLGCFEENFLPPLGAFRRGCKKSLFAATRCERHYGADAQLGGFFEGELEGVESNDRKKQRRLQSRLAGRQLLNQGKFDAITLHVFNARQPNAMAVAQFVKLAGLGPQDASQMVRRVASEDGAATRKFVNEKPPPHAPDSISKEGNYSPLWRRITEGSRKAPCLPAWGYKASRKLLTKEKRRAITPLGVPS